MQLILYAVYKDGKKENNNTSSPLQKRKAAGPDSMNTMEMGSYGQTNADNLPGKYVNGFERT